MAWVQSRWTRNRLLQAILIAPATALIAACTGGDDKEAASTTAAPAQTAASGRSATAAATEAARPAPAGTQAAQVLQPTPACDDGDDDEPTLAQTEGPYFTPNSPERASLLEPGLTGTRLTVSGSVLTTACQPVAGALLDFWQCDDAGVYDNRGYRLRGHQFTDENGRYRLETILPAVYPGRTRHIHVKVQAPNNPVLTTQQYFPGEAANRRDSIYRPELEMEVRDTGNGKEATFDYVLQVR
jgi:protocatechuate 3,4-dioxygenase beta subunit